MFICKYWKALWCDKGGQSSTASTGRRCGALETDSAHLQVLADAVGWRRGVEVVGRRAVAADGVQVVERRVRRLGGPAAGCHGRRTGRLRRRRLMEMGEKRRTGGVQLVVVCSTGTGSNVHIQVTMHWRMANGDIDVGKC